MKRSPLLWCLVLAVPSMATAADSSASEPAALYTLSAEAMPAEDGSSLSMTLRETERTPDFSLVTIEYVSGGSQASSLFLLRGLCGLMQAREHKLAVAEQVSEHPIRFRMAFPESAKIEETRGLPRMVLSEPDCARIQGRHE